MPSKWEKIAKCPNCLPDVKGAIFSLISGDTNSGYQWQCNNCHHKLPFVKHTGSNQVTPSQREVIDKLKALGWELDVSMIGCSVWIVGKRDLGNPGQNLLMGTSVYGKIGVRGAYKLTLQRLGTDAIITDAIGMEVYLKGITKSSS